MADDDNAPGETTINPNPVSSFDKVEDALAEVPKFEPTKTFTLRNPTKIGDELVKEITLRAPSGLDLMECGGRLTYPVWTPDPNSKDKNAQIMSIRRDVENIRKMLTRLSNRPMSAFYLIPAGDLNAMIQWMIDEVSIGGN